MFLVSAEIYEGTDLREVPAEISDTKMFGKNMGYSCLKVSVLYPTTKKLCSKPVLGRKIVTALHSAPP